MDKKINVAIVGLGLLGGSLAKALKLHSRENQGWGFTHRLGVL